MICTMLDLSKITGFEWDEGNIDKSYQKHGITPDEAEQVFVDKEIFLLEDVKHSQAEDRMTAIGKALNDKILFVAFTIRRDKIRIISARIANKKERRVYEQKT